MKQINIIITLLVVCLFSSCHKDELYDANHNGKAMLSIKLDILNSGIISRSVSSDADEKMLFNAYVFIFNSAGEKVYSKLHNSVSAPIAIADILGGKNMTVAVIANVDNSIMNTTSTILGTIKNKKELQESVSTMGDDYVERGTAFLMSGSLDVSLADKVNKIVIPLNRVDAKIKFNIKTKEGVTFLPSEWRVVSLPKNVFILPNDKKNVFFSDKGNYFTTKWKNYEPVSPELSLAGVKATFAFYSLESMLNAKKDIPTTGTDYERYALRDKQIKNENGTNKSEFEYANDAGTYVELKGDLIYDENTNLASSANVKFMIHLGGGIEDVNNYSTPRNTSYTYNVMINSADEINAEVVDNNEKRPGAEGDIVLANVIKEFDAYNSVFSMNFEDSNVGESLTWDVSTPFSKGNAEVDPKDNKWVYFRREKIKTNGYHEDGLKTYLGDHMVYDDVITNDTDASAFLDKYLKNIGTKVEKMLNVDQLVEILKESKRRTLNGSSGKTLFDGAGNATFTTFVLDYYYEKNPENIYETVENGLWKEFVNTDKRVLNILSKYQVSADGNSTKSVAKFSIRQASIQTMYSTDKTTNIGMTAFGSQFYPNEATNKSFTGGEGTAINGDKSNGRQNYAGFFNVGTSRWDTYINTITWVLKPGYDYAKYKSLSHNRDTDGDGIIDANEIQWYLASIDQLSVLWIGEEALHPTSKLYTSSTWDEARQHYVSSSVLNADNPQVLWASEGSGVGTLNGASPRDILYYRTVRNLGIPKEAALTTMPDKVYIYKAPQSTQTRTRTWHWINGYSDWSDWSDVAGTAKDGFIDLSRLDSKALRGVDTEMELPDHDLRDERGNNKPYKKFAIKYTTAGSGLTWEKVRARSQPGGSNPVAPAGWRVPNQRELSLMFIAMSDINGDIKVVKDTKEERTESLVAWPLAQHFSRTGFNLNWTKERPGFSVKGTFYLITSPGGTGGVRCVKDVKK